jgi:hypothetical protein
VKASFNTPPEPCVLGTKQNFMGIRYLVKMLLINAWGFERRALFAGISKNCAQSQRKRRSGTLKSSLISLITSVVSRAKQETVILRQKKPKQKERKKTIILEKHDHASQNKRLDHK